MTDDKARELVARLHSWSAVPINEAEARILLAHVAEATAFIEATIATNEKPVASGPSYLVGSQQDADWRYRRLEIGTSRADFYAMPNNLLDDMQDLVINFLRDEGYDARAEVAASVMAELVKRPHPDPKVKELRAFLAKEFAGSIVTMPSAGVDLLDFFDHSIAPALRAAIAATED